MRISLMRYVKEGEKLPMFYGIAYVEYWKAEAVAYPVPINLVVRFARSLWWKMAGYVPTERDRMLKEAYERGRKDEKQAFHDTMTKSFLNVVGKIERDIFIGVDTSSKPDQTGKCRR